MLLLYSDKTEVVSKMLETWCQTRYLLWEAVASNITVRNFKVGLYLQYISKNRNILFQGETEKLVMHLLLLGWTVVIHCYQAALKTL